jgi:xylulokinase
VSKILSIDLGTTYFKIALFDRDGRLCDTCRIAPPTVATNPGWMELPVDGFCDVIARGIAEIGSRGDLGDVEAVTFATQTNSFTLLDAANRALTPLILWPDRRAGQLEDEVRRRSDVPGFSATTGIPQLNHQCMVAKLLWLQDRSPEIWRRTSKLCLISDYLTLRLTGQCMTEAGAAGLTGLLDVRRCQWSPELLTRFEIDASPMLAIVRAGTDLGPIDAHAARCFGLPSTCRFIVGCLDQYAGAIGVGNVDAGMISETTGTVLSTVRCAAEFSEELAPPVLQGPAFREGLYWRMAFGQVSANYLEWYREQLPDRPEFDRLIAEAEPIAPGADGLKLRTDVALTTSPTITEVFDGLTARHTCGHQVRCILEATGYAMHDLMASLCDGSLPGEIRCAGGAAQSDLWLQIKADVSGVATAATLCREPTSLGAAMLARAAIDGSDVQTVARHWVGLKRPHHPNPQRHQQYQALRCQTTN